MADLLGSQGPLSRRMAGYEARLGQIEMATAVEQALDAERVLLCEAGTGTGKTLAYLVPAILSGKTVVVSTATRALQHQIVDKDLPLIAETLDLSPRAAMMKGLSNYLCRRRYASFRSSGEAARPPLAASLAVVDQWVASTETGDLSELSVLSEDDPVIEAVASSSDTRVGSPCPFYEECFVTKMKRDAEVARLIVVNHHLFFADLALRGPHPGRVIPDYDAVIFDEAHQLEDIATAFFSVSVSTSRLTRLLRELGRALKASGLGDPLLSGGGGLALLNEAERAQRCLFDAVGVHARAGEGRFRLDDDAWQGDCRSAYHRIDTALEGLAALSERSKNELDSASGGPKGRTTWALAEAFEVAGRRCQQLRSDLATIVEGAPGRVTWVEVGRRSTTLSSSPIDVSELFRERVFDRIPSVVLTSATLASSSSRRSGEPFRFLKTRLGIEQAEPEVSELIVASPFAFERNALLYVPDDLPAPGDAAFGDGAAARIADLVEITDGGAFVLTTSTRAMTRLHRELEARLSGRQVLVQGSAPKGRLLGAFRAERNAVLVATMSFWQGVDVPGQALRLVVLDKIPFPVPSDPIVEARSRALEGDGKNAFMELFLPAAKIVLKQGFGRLIRTRRDYGVVALLDDRVYQKGYGKKLLDALPPAARTRDLEEVRRFWQMKSTPASDRCESPVSPLT